MGTAFPATRTTLPARMCLTFAGTALFATKITLPATRMTDCQSQLDTGMLLPIIDQMLQWLCQLQGRSAICSAVVNTWKALVSIMMALPVAG